MINFVKQGFALENVEDGDRSYLVRLSPLQADNLSVIKSFIKGETHSESFEIPRVQDRISPEQVDAEQMIMRIPRGNKFCTGISYTAKNVHTGLYLIEPPGI